MVNDRMRYTDCDTFLQCILLDSVICDLVMCLWCSDSCGKGMKGGVRVWVSLRDLGAWRGGEWDGIGVPDPQIQCVSSLYSSSHDIVNTTIHFTKKKLVRVTVLRIFLILFLLSITKGTRSQALSHARTRHEEDDCFFGPTPLYSQICRPGAGGAELIRRF